MSNAVNPGDFNALKVDDFERTMLEDAYKAVTKSNRWDFLRRSDVPGPKGFMFSSWPQMKDIDTNMEYQGHSGASYGWTMRQMEFIAKQGWDVYANKVGHKPSSEPDPVPGATSLAKPSILEQAVTVDNFIQTLPKETDLTGFVNAIQNDKGMREMIPDIDEQAAALRKFSEGKMSYFEMRTLCG